MIGTDAKVLEVLVNQLERTLLSVAHEEGKPFSWLEGVEWVEHVEAAIEQVLMSRISDSSRVGECDESGRLAILLIDLNLMDGAVQDASLGFFDQYNFPPIQTWVGLVKEGVSDVQEPSLVFLVPSRRVKDVQAGIDTNPEECLCWMTDSAPQLESLLLESLTGKKGGTVRS